MDNEYVLVHNETEERNADISIYFNALYWWNIQDNLMSDRNSISSKYLDCHVAIIEKYFALILAVIFVRG